MGLELCQLPVSRRLTLACWICGWVHLLPPDILAKKGVRVAVMPTHTWREHDGRAWLYTKKNPQTCPIHQNGAVWCWGDYKARLESAPCSLSNSRCIQQLAESGPQAWVNHSSSTSNPSTGLGGAPVPALPTAAFPASSPASAPIHQHQWAEPDDTAWSKHIFLPYKTTEQDIWLLLPEAWGIINPPYLAFLITSALKYPSLSQPLYF